MSSRILPVLLSILLFTGCGYRLRGTEELALGVNKVYVVGGSGQLLRQLRESVKFAGGKVVRVPAKADLVLHIVREEMERRVISLSTTGKANEFEYIYTVDYEVTTPAGKKVLPSQAIELSRDFFNDQLDAIGKTNEAMVLRSELYQNAASMILRQSSLALRHTRAQAQ